MAESFVLATGGSEDALEAEKYLTELLDPDQHRIIVISVAKEFEGETVAHGEDPSVIRSRLLEGAESIAEQAATRLRDAGFDVVTRSPIGHPGEEICKLAETEDAAGIIMGRRGRGTLGELLLGSVSQYVVHHASCPVIITPGGASS